MKKFIVTVCAFVSFSHLSFGQWSLTGNFGINPSIHYLGTNDPQDLVFRTAATEWMRLSKNGLLGIGLTVPSAKIDLLMPSSYLTTLESGFRITYPSAAAPPPVLNNSIFEIRSTILGNYYSKFIVKDNGNIGIGINEPTYKLHIHNSSTASGTAIRVDGINGHIRLFETDGSNSESYTQIERNGDAFHIYQRDITSPNFEHVFTAAMDGNVGFGDGAPHPDIKMFVDNREKSVGLCINNTQTTNNSYGLKCIVNNATTKSLAVTNFSDGMDVFRVMGDGIVWCTELNVDVKGDFPDYVFDENYNLMPLNELQKFIKTEKHLPDLPTAEEVAENGIAVSEMTVIQTKKIEELTLYLLQLNESLEKLKEQNEDLQERITELESE